MSMLLPQADAAQFFRLMWGLQFYVNQQLRLIPEVGSLAAYTSLPIEQKIIVRDTLWQQPQWIAAYLQANPDQLSIEDLTIVAHWQKFIAGKFYILRYLKKHAIFIKDTEVYGVKGLYDPFEVVLGSDPLPLLVEATLLPYKGQIIYDGTCRAYNIYFGPGIRQDLNETYMTAKQNGRIQLSLEEEAATRATPGKPRRVVTENKKILAEMAQTETRLQGNTPLQKAAFSVLRDSVVLAEAVVAQPEDVEALWHLGRKVGNALRRLERALERAER